MTTTHLFVKNASVDAHNNTIYANSTHHKAEIKAVDIIAADASDSLK